MDEYIIAENINLDDYSGEHFSFYIADKVGYMVDLKKSLMVNIDVEAEEGTFPHIHLKTKEGDFELCVRIDECRYFNHEKHMKGNFLNSTQRKEFNNFMKAKHKKLPKYTNWEYAFKIWNFAAKTRINSDMIPIPEGTTQPDYNKLKDTDL